MTYPRGLPSTMQPSNIHDATWGAMSAVYGGAFHPSAEGHAVMADAALPAVREALGLTAPPEVIAQPLPPPGQQQSRRADRRSRSERQPTPSFFCRLDDDVVYWNVSFLSG